MTHQSGKSSQASRKIIRKIDRQIIRETTVVLGAGGAHLMAARQRMNLAMPPPASAPG